MHTFNVDEMHKRSVWTYFYNQPSNFLDDDDDFKNFTHSN